MAYSRVGLSHELLTQDFIFYAGDPMIRCVLNADWWEDRKDLKLSAETGISNPRAFYKVPFGRLERPVKRETPYEKARFEVPAITYADLVGDDGYSFALLNRTKHGYDVLNGRVRLSSPERTVRSVAAIIFEALSIEPVASFTIPIFLISARRIIVSESIAFPVRPGIL